MDKRIIAEIIVDNKSANTDMLYSYQVPKKYEENIKVGIRVMIPFGRGNRLLEGIVIKLSNDNDFKNIKLKDIDSIIDITPILSKDMVKLGLWMKGKYLAKHIEVFRTIMPTGISSKVKKYIKLVENFDYTSMQEINSEKQQKIIRFLIENKKSELNIMKKQLQMKDISNSLKILKDKDIIEIHEVVETGVKKKYEKIVNRKFEKKDIKGLLEGIIKSANKQKQIIEYMVSHESVNLRELMKETSSSLSSIRAVEKRGYIEIQETEVKRNPVSTKILATNKKILTRQQKYCVDTILVDIEKNTNNKFLIHGITGSGKTEIYLQLIEKMVQSNKQSIVLVPEISLTPQTVERFIGRFGDRVAVLHSRLSLGERYDEWRRIHEKEVQIVVGARSAIFAPFDNLGLIVIDEEHETSYKSSMNPKYDTIEVAEKRCQLENATLILGTATPAIKTYYRALQGEIKLLELTERTNKKPLPEVKVVDMKEELDKGNKSIFSESLSFAINQNLKRGQQTILFLNRRGFSTFVSCRKCGYVAKCKECDISLTYHLAENILKCHYCGATMRPPKICPECGSKYIKYFGIGTQKIEEMVRKTFPKARVERMDVDTTSRKGSHERIFNRVKRGEIDILIGTQMITKGLDFPNVTLVGIIAADMSLNLPDYRASERTFQLITQVSGRSGRDKLTGRVILQTYEPEHSSIQAAKLHDYETFYEEEIKIREEFQYPPFTNIINVVISSKDERRVYGVSKRMANNIRDLIKKEIRNYENIDFLGPNPAPLAKIKGKYRWQIIIKCKDSELEKIKSVVSKECSIYIPKEKNDDLRVSIDINPNSIM